jgi:hypothetical protein
VQDILESYGAEVKAKATENYEQNPGIDLQRSYCPDFAVRPCRSTAWTATNWLFFVGAKATEHTHVWLGGLNGLLKLGEFGHVYEGIIYFAPQAPNSLKVPSNIELLRSDWYDLRALPLDMRKSSAFPFRRQR